MESLFQFFQHIQYVTYLPQPSFSFLGIIMAHMRPCILNPSLVIYYSKSRSETLFLKAIDA